MLLCSLITYFFPISIQVLGEVGGVLSTARFLSGLDHRFPNCLVLTCVAQLRPQPVDNAGPEMLHSEEPKWAPTLPSISI